MVRYQKEQNIKCIIRLRRNNNKSVELLIARRRLTFISRVIRMSNNFFLTIILSLWCKGKRKNGRVYIIINHSLVNDISKIGPSVN